MRLSTKIRDKKILGLYKNGISPKNIAKKFHVSLSTIHKRFSAMNIHLNSLAIINFPNNSDD